MRLDHICNFKVKEEVSSDFLLTKLDIQDIDGLEEMTWSYTVKHLILAASKFGSFIRLTYWRTVV